MSVDTRSSQPASTRCDELAEVPLSGQQLLRECMQELRARHTPASKSPSALPQTGVVPWAGSREKIDLEALQAGTAILQATDRQQVEIVIAAIQYVVDSHFACPISDRLCHQLLKSLIRKKLPYTDQDLSRLLRQADAAQRNFLEIPLLSILTNVARCTESRGIDAKTRAALEQLSKTYHPEAYGADERKVGERIQQLLAAAEAQKGAAEVASATSMQIDLHTGEAWTLALEKQLEPLDALQRRVWAEYLDHCQSATASKPSQKWLRTAEALQRSLDSAALVAVLVDVLAAIGKPGAAQRFNHGGHIFFGDETQVHDTHANLLRGLIWSTSLLDDERLIAPLGDAAEKCFQKIPEVGPRCPKTGNACLIALSSLPNEHAVAQLGRLKSRAKHASTRTQIAKAFERAAQRMGIHPDDLEEIGVPSFGLQEVGRYEQVVGDFTARFDLHPNRKATGTWTTGDGRSLKTVPKEVRSNHAEKLKRVKKTIKDIDTLMPSIRFRIEALFTTNRDWSLQALRSRFLEHPVVGVVAQNLIWNIQSGADWRTGMWMRDRFVDAQGKQLTLPQQDVRLSLWHPMQSLPEEVLAWRRFLVEHEIQQPFKQAHREVYLLTDAERDTCVYSNRFAAHILKQHQFAALCKQRGWRYELQGEWDSWNIPYLELPHFGIRAEFLVEPQAGLQDTTMNFVYTQVSTAHVRFVPGEPRANQLPLPMELADVPARAFSEVMRDVDLFVGVCSVGNDPAWQEIGQETGQLDYWQKFSFGELSATATTRQQIVSELLPQLGLAKCCHVDGRFLVVTGKLRTYRIHFGSGNVLMSPNDEYLCIVQKRGTGARRTDNIYLPFEGDNTLSLILSKAFLLAEDDQIRDATIRNQIRLDK